MHRVEVRQTSAERIIYECASIRRHAVSRDFFHARAFHTVTINFHMVLRLQFDAPSDDNCSSGVQRTSSVNSQFFIFHLLPRLSPVFNVERFSRLLGTCKLIKRDNVIYERLPTLSLLQQAKIYVFWKFRSHFSRPESECFISDSKKLFVRYERR
jgi:hypothetical protein